MNNKILILAAMIQGLIIADYNLQGCLASAKQRKYWKENAPKKMYQYDYIMALFMHSFCWTCLIMIPALISERHIYFWILAFLNTVIHMYVDNEKANKETINLVEYHIIHFIQIFLTLGILLL